MVLLNSQFVSKCFNIWYDAIYAICLSTPDDMDHVVTALDAINQLIYGDGVECMRSQDGKDIYLVVDRGFDSPTILYNIENRTFEAAIPSDIAYIHPELKYLVGK